MCNCMASLNYFTAPLKHICVSVGSSEWLSIIYGPDRTNGPEEGLVHDYKRGTGPNGIINGPDRSSTLLRGTIYVTGFWKTYHLHTSEIIRISDFEPLWL